MSFKGKKMSTVLTFIRKQFCRFNIHYHPEDDGLYISDISHGRCYACGALIKKTKNEWKESDVQK